MFVASANQGDTQPRTNCVECLAVESNVVMRKFPEGWTHIVTRRAIKRGRKNLIVLQFERRKNKSGPRLRFGLASEYRSGDKLDNTTTVEGRNTVALACARGPCHAGAEGHLALSDLEGLDRRAADADFANLPAAVEAAKADLEKGGLEWHDRQTADSKLRLTGGGCALICVDRIRSREAPSG